ATRTTPERGGLTPSVTNLSSEGTGERGAPVSMNEIGLGISSPDCDSEEKHPTCNCDGKLNEVARTKQEKIGKNRQILPVSTVPGGLANRTIGNGCAFLRR